MTVGYVLAQGGDMPSWIAPAIRATLFTAGGVALLVVGIRRRVARARWDRNYDRRPLPSDGPPTSEEQRTPTPKPGAWWRIALGVVLALLGLLHILDLVVTLHLSGVI